MTIPFLSINNISQNEGNSGSSTFDFVVFLSEASPTTTTVNYVTGEIDALQGLDYEGGFGTVTFAPGETSKVIPVTVYGDLFYEINETFLVTLSDASGATISPTAYASVGTIINDDPVPALSIDSPSQTEGNSGTSTLTFTVTLSSPTGFTQVDYATADGTAVAGTDYTAQSGTLFFNSDSTSQTITVPVNDDMLFEGNETFTVNLSSVSNGSITAPSGIAAGSGIGTIVNDDGMPSLSIAPVSQTEGNAGVSTFDFIVSLSQASGLMTTVDFATADGSAVAGSDYVARSGTLSFAPGETSQTISVVVNGDALVEDDDAFTVNLSNAVNATIATAAGTGTILDDDAAPPVAQNGAASGDEDSGIAGELVATDNDSPSLSYALVGQAAHGEVHVNSDGTFSYAPDGDYNGPDSFTFTANDGLLDSNVATEFLTVDPVNDAPVNTVPGAQTIVEDATLAIAGLSISDVDAGSGSMSTTLTAAHGTLSVAAQSGASVTGSGSTTVVITGSLAQIDATLAAGNVGYHPAAHYVRSDTLTVTTDDSGNTGAGGPITDTDLVAIKVTDLPPMAAPSDGPLTPPSGDSSFDGTIGDHAVHFGFKLTDATFTFEGNKVVVDTPTSHTELTGFQTYVFTDGTVNQNDGDPLVDDLYYYAQNQDVWNAHADADQHYHASGWQEGRNPDAFFDTKFYLATNADVRSAGVDPLVQYDTAGWKAGRDPSSVFDTNAYLAANPDVLAAGVDPLAHFLANGEQEGRHATAVTSLIAPNGFDYVYYFEHNPDVAAAGVDPYQHYETVGWKEGRNPNAYFDDLGYLAHHADVAAAGVNPLDHYDQSGWTEGRDPSVNFDTTGYLSHYRDVAAAQLDPLLHYLQSGLHEGRSAFADGVWA